MVGRCIRYLDQIHSTGNLGNGWNHFVGNHVRENRGVRMEQAHDFQEPLQIDLALVELARL